MRREAVTVALCLILGWLLIPAAIFLVGQQFLGPYERGGYFSFVRDIAAGVISGSWTFWLLVLAPYGGIWLIRLWRLVWR